MGKTAMTAVLVCSKLPMDLVIHHPQRPQDKVTLKGTNSSRILDAAGNYSAPAAGYVTTEVDADFWEAWMLVHNQPGTRFAALDSGAIFEAKDAASAKSIAAEFSKRKTGLEPLGTDGKDDRAPGVKKRNDKD